MLTSLPPATFLFALLLVQLGCASSYSLANGKMDDGGAMGGTIRDMAEQLRSRQPWSVAG